MFYVDFKKQFPDRSMDIKFASDSGITVFFGRSGAGKSVTLRCIAGLVEPDNGEIVVGGKVYFSSEKKINLAPQNRKTGYVFQTYALFPHLTVSENLLIVMNSPANQANRQKVRDLLSEVGIAELENRYPGGLSGGEQQRVALARALARDPEVLLLDEPFSAVDVPGRDRLRLLLKKVQRQRNIPAILVTHQSFEAFSMADNIVVMNKGSVEQIGSPQDVFYRPITITTARLVGAKNIFQGLVEAVDDQSVFIKHGDLIFEAQKQSGDISPGNQVHWCIRPEAVMVLREDRPGFNYRENRIEGFITEIEKKGPVWEIFFITEYDIALKIEVSAHGAQQMKLSQAKKITVSLKKDAMHIIQLDDLAPKEQQTGSQKSTK